MDNVFCEFVAEQRYIKSSKSSQLTDAESLFISVELSFWFECCNFCFESIQFTQPETFFIGWTIDYGGEKSNYSRRWDFFFERRRSTAKKYIGATHEHLYLKFLIW